LLASASGLDDRIAERRVYRVCTDSPRRGSAAV